MATPNIYLDIDGAVIHEDLANYNKPAAYLLEFLKALDRYDVYWLTTHCRNNDASYAIARLKRVLPDEYMKYVEQYLPTAWTGLKTEAIDFSKPFIWFDNDGINEEREVLKKNRAEDSLVEVNLIENPNQLLEITKDVLLELVK